MGVVGSLLVLVFLCYVFWYMFKGVGKYPGPKIKGVMSDRHDPGEIRWVAAALGSLAVGQGYVDLGGSADIGLDMVVVVGIGLVVAAISLIPGAGVNIVNFVAAAVALLGLWGILVGDHGIDDVAGVGYRLILIIVLLASFMAGSLLSVFSASFLRVGGLGLFALVEVLAFFLSPNGNDTMELGWSAVGTYLVVVCAASFAMGFLASPFTLGIACIAVSVTTLLSTQVSPESMGGVIAAMVGGAAALLITRRFNR